MPQGKPIVRIPAAAKPSKEELAAEHYRAFSQQMQSIAQAILYNLCHNAGPDAGPALVDKSLEMAAHYMHTAGLAVKAAFEKQMELAAAESKANKED